jgi:DNA polymerase I-like protein with 3'-5' exonuclease and polymerase domains
MKQYIIINALNFDSALAELEATEIIAYDTETTGLNVRKDKVIGFSFTCVVNTGWYLPLRVYDKKRDTLDDLENFDMANILLKALAKKKLIMHNASFDVRVTANNLGVNLLNALYADTQLMIHTLREEGPFALKDNAVLLAAELSLDGQDAANQEQLELELNVKANGGKWLKSNKEMFKADLDVLAKYAIADTDITLRLFQYLNEQLHLENAYELFHEEVMPLQKTCTIRMEHRGVHLDIPKLEQYNKEILEELKIIEKNVVEAILDTEAGQQFVQQKLDTEFPPKNTGSFAQAICEYYAFPLPKTLAGKYSITKKTLDNLGSGDLIEAPVIEFLKGEGYLSSEFILEIQKKLMFAKGGEYAVNIGSKQQLGKIVFELMGITPLSKTEKGAPQFNEAIIDHLVEEHDLLWAKELRVFNKLTKIQGSYYQRFLDQQEFGIFYPTFKQHGTTSGRYGSDMQQLSKPIEDEEDNPEDTRIIKYTNILRELFIAPTGFKYLDDDYESLEPRVFADDAADQALIDIFTKNLDMYSVVAIGAEKLEGVSADKKAPNFLKKLHPNKRQNAKAYALGIRYGMKAFKLHKALNITLPEAQEIIDNYFKSFPGLKAAMDKYLTEAKTTGKVVSKYGRIRHLPRVREIYRKFGDEILEYKNLKGISTKKYIPMKELQDIRKEYNNLLNNALNFPIQAAGASIVNRAMIAMTRRFQAEKLNAWVSLQIHDQIVVTCAEKDIDRAKEIMQDSMENTNKLLMPLIAVPEVTNNLKDGH